MPTLIVTEPGGARSAVRLYPGKKRLLGSDARCSVRLQPTNAAPLHCEVYYEGGLWHVRNLDTARGTFVNGRPAQEETLASEDVIQIGSARLTFLVEEKRTSPIRGLRSGPPPAAVRPVERRGRRSVSRRSVARKPSSAPLVMGSLAASLVFLLVVAAVNDQEEDAPSEEKRPQVASQPTRARTSAPRDSTARASRSGEAPSGREMESPTSARPIGQYLTEESIWDEGREATDREVAAVGRARPSRGRGSNDPVEPLSRNEALFPAPEKQATAGASRPPRRTGSLSETLARGAPARASTSLSSESPRATAWRPAVLEDLALLDLEGARALLDAARKKGAAEGELAELEAECGALSGILQRLERALEAASRGRATFDLEGGSYLISAAPDTELLIDAGEAGRVRILEVDFPTVTLGDRRGNPLGRVCVISLPDSVLLSTLASGSEKSPEERAADRQQLARLLLHVEGPARARAIMAPLEKAGTADPLLTVSCLTAAEIGTWPARKAVAIARARKRLDAEERVQPSDWALLASRAFRALHAVSSSWSPSSSPSAVGERETIEPLREAFLAARARSYPRALLFHADQVETAEDGLVQLTYRFPTERRTLPQLADLHAKHVESKAPRYFRNRLLLQGEYRLLEGDPFLDQLAVEGTAVPLTRDSPNVNIALWTQPGDNVTCRDGASESWMALLRSEPGTPSDYFVFGMGYRTVVCSSVSQPVEQVLVVGTKESVDLPAILLLGGSHGTPLHKDLGECLRAEEVAPEALRRVTFRVDWRPEAVRWQVNGREIPIDDGLHGGRLQALPTRRGSITILTNGQQVAFEEIVVTGRLDPGWILERARPHALEELEPDS